MMFKKPLTAEEICQKLKPIFGEKIDKIYLSYATCESRDTKEEILSMLNTLYHKHFDQLLEQPTLLEPPKEDMVRGDYKIGNVVYGKQEAYPFFLREKDMPRHVCVTGMSGSGKTTMAFNILDGLIAKNKPFLVFDWKKSFRPLLAKDHKLACFTIGDNKLTNNFKMNLNKPPKGVSPKEWITVICDLIAESFFVSYGVHKVLLETLDESFKEWGVYSGSGNYPTWNHIKWRLDEKMEKAKNREQGWIESAMRVATVLTFGDFGEVVNYKGDNSVNIEDLMDKRVVFEMNALGNIEKKFFCEFVLMYLYKLKKAKQNEVDGKFNYAILVDEAHNIFLKDKTNFSSESVTDMIYREMREYGVSLICLDQHISKLSDTVKGNSACHIAFQQQLPEDIDNISRLMHLYDQKEYFSSLAVGTAVVKLSDRYTKPFCVKAPFSDTRGLKVSNEDIKGRVQRLLLKNDYENESDVVFNKSVKEGKQLNMAELFKKIKLPKLNLYADNAVNGKKGKKAASEAPLSVRTPVLEQTQIEIEPIYQESEVSHAYQEGVKAPVYVDHTGETDFEHDNRNLSQAQKTIYAIIKRKLGEDEEFWAIERDLEAIYDPSDVMLMVNKAMKEDLSAKPKGPKVIEKIVEKVVEKIVPVETPAKMTFEKPVIRKAHNIPVLAKRTTLSLEEAKKNEVKSTKIEENATESDKKVENKEKDTIRKSYKASFDSGKYGSLTAEENKFIIFLGENPSHELTTVKLYKNIGFSPRKGNTIKNKLMEKNLLKIKEVKYDQGWKKIIRLI